MAAPVERFKETYNRLNARSLHLLAGLYSEHVVFQDPFHRVEGLDALRSYFTALYSRTESCSFVFHEELVDPGSAVLIWTMSLTHPRLNGGEPIQVPGATHIRFGDTIHYHRDYFDGGALIYEHLPVVGALVRAIKRRVQ